MSRKSTVIGGKLVFTSGTGRASGPGDAWLKSMIGEKRTRNHKCNRAVRKPSWAASFQVATRNVMIENYCTASKCASYKGFKAIKPAWFILVAQRKREKRKSF